MLRQSNEWADSGHGVQTICEDNTEWDGRNEGNHLSSFNQLVMTLHKGIVAMDGEYIVDDVRAWDFQVQAELISATVAPQ